MFWLPSSRFKVFSPGANLVETAKISCVSGLRSFVWVGGRDMVSLNVLYEATLLFTSWLPEFCMPAVGKHMLYVGCCSETYILAGSQYFTLTKYCFPHDTVMESSIQLQ